MDALKHAHPLVLARALLDTTSMQTKKPAISTIALLTMVAVIITVHSQARARVTPDMTLPAMVKLAM